MFAFLFGYGMVQLYPTPGRRRHARSGRPADSPPAQRMVDRLRLRGRRLAVDGRHPRRVRAGRPDHGRPLLPAPGSDVVDLGRRRHALLTFGHDLRRRRQLLRRRRPVGLRASSRASSHPPWPSPRQANYLASIPMRLLVWAILTPAAGRADPVVPIVILLAFWAGRREILERPEDRPAAATGGRDRDRDRLGGGLPHALDHIGVLPVPDQVAWVFSATQPVTGMCAGPRLRRRVRPAGSAGS